MEELQTSLSLKGLTVTTTPGKGRCLVTTKHFSPGDVIISQEPYVYIPNTSFELRCDGCFAKGTLKKCSGCQVSLYCGSACQKAEWKFHKLECKVLARLDKERKEMLTPTIRLMTRLCLKRMSQNEGITPTTATDNYSLVEALVDHMQDIDEKQMVLYAQMANLVGLILQSPGMDIKDISCNFSKLACNAHTICDSEFRPLGTGLYPVVSIINHSCLPNSVLVFERRLAVIRATEPLPKGTEVLISYIETAGSNATRQKALIEQYLFTCTCSRCTKLSEDIEEVAILEGYRCNNDICDGFMLGNSNVNGFECQQCGIVRNKEEIGNIASEVKLMANKASASISVGNCTYLEARDMYNAIEKLQATLCHSLSIDLMRTRETLMKVLLELKDWRGALTYCRLTIPVYQRAYPRIHPLLGLQYYICGKLEWLLEETDASLRSLTKAFDILRITHGTNSSLTKDLLTKMVEAQRQAAYEVSSADKQHRLKKCIQI